ncbi:dynein light chain Tctex-type 5 isoform X2 [Rhineura floridana]|uniref:dynein light chain Tctex-type 5 isoform X2 n=1 Tax=Rhineura floridana TaxID=261503 RepID=UPI002AC7FE9D|nr:dynein light chain Tctex-type 5 isoform X2 [Rhineura floridana]
MDLKRRLPKNERRGWFARGAAAKVSPAVLPAVGEVAREAPLVSSRHCALNKENMSDTIKEKAARLLRKRGSISSLGSHEVKAKEFIGKNKDSISTASYMDEAGHHDDILRPAVQIENTYQLGPAKCFPVVTVNNILKDVVTSYLQEEKYEAELCRQMTKTISEMASLILSLCTGKKKQQKAYYELHIYCKSRNYKKEKISLHV